MVSFSYSCILMLCRQIKRHQGEGRARPPKKWHNGKIFDESVRELNEKLSKRGASFYIESSAVLMVSVKLCYVSLFFVEKYLLHSTDSTDHERFSRFIETYFSL